MSTHKSFTTCFVAMYSLGLIVLALGGISVFGDDMGFQDDVHPLAMYDHGSPSSLLENIFVRNSPLFSWPKGDVPYILDYQFSAKQRRSVIDAMKKIEAVSCVSFRPASLEDSSHLEIRRGGWGYDCYYQRSRFFGLPSIINLGSLCFSEDTLIHELLHALGMPHQHEVTNRDDYVTIHWDNIRKDARDQFKKRPTLSQAEKEVGYDYESITHYSPYAGAIDQNRPTITPKNPSVILKQNTEMTAKDIKKLNIMYNC